MLQSLSLQEQSALLKRVAGGDTAAFRILFDAYNRRIYAAALKMTKSTYGAEEIVQEIFASLWENRNNLQNVENPPAYIFTVAYNRTYRYLKKVAADTNMLQTLKLHIREYGNEIEDLLDMKETGELINHAVEKLPPRRKLIFKLSREEGLSHKEIADQLDISPLTVKKQMVMALRTIRASLSGVSPLLALFFTAYLCG